MEDTSQPRSRRIEKLTPREAARRLRIRLDLTYALIWAGKLEARKQEGRWLIPASAVEARLRKRQEVRDGKTGR